jgi:hypothetical protein
MARLGSGIQDVTIKKLRLSSRVEKGGRITLEVDVARSAWRAGVRWNPVERPALRPESSGPRPGCERAVAGESVGDPLAMGPIPRESDDKPRHNDDQRNRHLERRKWWRESTQGSF